MEYTSGDKAALDVRGDDPFAPGGGGSDEKRLSFDVSGYISIDEGSQLEEQPPSLDVSDYMSIDEGSQLEEQPPSLDVSDYFSIDEGSQLEEQPPSLDVSDYFSIDEGSQLEEHSPAFGFTGECYQGPFLLAEDTGESSMVGRTSSSLKCKGGVQQEKIMERETMRYVFRTKSEREVLIDGYRWRKYGKKAVKSSPHPRHYFRCTAEGCCVKKTVERDQEDDSYVLTSYVGNHGHPPPGEVYYPVPRTHDAGDAFAAGAQRGPSGGSF